MLTNDLVPCFIQSFGMDSKTGYEKALLVGLSRTMKRLCALSASARSSSRLPPCARIGRNAVSRTCPTAGMGASFNDPRFH